MNQSRSGIITVAVFLLATAGLSAQAVSARKDIAVFNLSYYDFAIPRAALGAVDEQIRSVIIRIGRFNVIGLNQRVDNKDVNEFIQKIKDYKERKVEIPESVLMGRAAFTESDFNRLVGSFIVVVPAVSFYNVETARDGTRRATIQTSFTFFNVEEGRTLGQFFVETVGQDRNERNAVKEAVDGIADRLTFELRRIPEFQIRTGILEINGPEVVFELGEDMGVMVGDEYSVISASVRAGYETTRETGLLVVKEVDERFSVARVLYAEDGIAVGDQLREVPRVGVEGTIYGGAVIADSGDSAFLGYLGLKAVGTRGFYSVRPVVGVEVPLSWEAAVGLLVDIIPINAYVGAEITNIYMGRLQAAPTLVLGAGGAYLSEGARAFFNTDEEFFMTQFGGKAFVSLNYLFDRDTKVTLDIGVAAWFSWVEYLLSELKLANISGSVFATRIGPFIGAGITLK